MNCRGSAFSRTVADGKARSVLPLGDVVGVFGARDAEHCRDGSHTACIAPKRPAPVGVERRFVDAAVAILRATPGQTLCDETAELLRVAFGKTGLPLHLLPSVAIGHAPCFAKYFVRKG